jgi:hypothetical protein
MITFKLMKANNLEITSIFVTKELKRAEYFQHTWGPPADVLDGEDSYKLQHPHGNTQ